MQYWSGRFVLGRGAWEGGCSVAQNNVISYGLIPYQTSNGCYSRGAHGRWSSFQQRSYNIRLRYRYNYYIFIVVGNTILIQRQRFRLEITHQASRENVFNNNNNNITLLLIRYVDKYVYNIYIGRSFETMITM